MFFDLLHMLSPRQLMPRAVAVTARKRRLSNEERIVGGRVMVGEALVNVRIWLGHRGNYEHLLQRPWARAMDLATRRILLV